MIIVKWILIDFIKCNKLLERYYSDCHVEYSYLFIEQNENNKLRAWRVVRAAGARFCQLRVHSRRRALRACPSAHRGRPALPHVRAAQARGTAPGSAAVSPAASLA